MNRPIEWKAPDARKDAHPRGLFPHSTTPEF
jgi:hypothetical protein